MTTNKQEFEKFLNELGNTSSPEFKIYIDRMIANTEVEMTNFGQFLSLMMIRFPSYIETIEEMAMTTMIDVLKGIKVDDFRSSKK